MHILILTKTHSRSTMYYKKEKRTQDENAYLWR